MGPLGSIGAAVNGIPPLKWYRRVSRSAPFATAFATCAMKGSASDAVAQLKLERRKKLDVGRNAAFALFSGGYLGIGQHYVYNVAFARIFGTATDLTTTIKKVLADSTVHVPLIYLPLYYPFETVVLGKGNVMDGLRKYRSDAPTVLRTYWSMWPPVHAISFGLLPPELRIGFVATISFVWLIFLSNQSHKATCLKSSGS